MIIAGRKEDEDEAEDQLNQIVILEKKENSFVPLSLEENDNIPLSKDERKRSKKKKRRESPELPSISLRAILTKKQLYNFCFGHNSKRLAMPFIAIALLFGIFFESCRFHLSYNVLLLLVLEASILFHHFPKRSIRAQLSLAVLIILSFAVDIYLSLAVDTLLTSNSFFITAFSFFLAFKMLSFWNYLLFVNGGSKVRKYLHRRLRLFFPPCSQPKRIMRDVRGRLLALGWLQGFATLCYLFFFLLFYFYYDYKSYYLSTETISSLNIFLVVKFVTSALVLSGILYDTDLRLCLWYFGCLGFAIDYIRSYIQQKMKKLGGFPLSFSFYRLRFQILCGVKLVDFLWGLFGWIVIAPFLFGLKVYQIDESVRIFLSFLLFLIVVSDLYCGVLFGGVYWLLRRIKAIEKLKLLGKSDDSEIEEFNLLSKQRRARDEDFV